MNNGHHDRLETLLREHLHRELNPQLGRAADRFLLEVNAPAPIPIHPRRKLRWFAWSGGLAGAALAASVMIVMFLNGLIAPPREMAPQVVFDQSVDPPLVPAGNMARDFEHAVSWETIDRGTVYLDDEIPMRSLVRQQVESVRWFDPQRNATVELQVPRDEVMLVGYNSF